MISTLSGFPKRRPPKRGPKSRYSKGRSYLASFESLESKQLLAYTAEFADGVLTFEGNGLDSNETVQLTMQGVSTDSGGSTETLTAQWNDIIHGLTTATFPDVTAVAVNNPDDDSDIVSVIGSSGRSIELNDAKITYGGFLPIYTSGVRTISLDAGTTPGAVTLAGEHAGEVVVSNASIVSINDGAPLSVLALSVRSQSISFADTLSASEGIVSLRATQDGILASGLIEADILSMTSVTGIDVRSKVRSLSAAVTGTGDILVSEIGGNPHNGLNVESATTPTGSIALEVASGDLIIAGAVSGSADVTLLTKAGSITGSGVITAALLDIQSSGHADVRTTAIRLQAKVNSKLTVTESDSLMIGSSGIEAGGRVSITTGSAITRVGGLSSGFPIIAPQLVVENKSTALGGPAGSILLTSVLNDVDFFSAKNAAPSGAVTFRDLDDLTVGVDGSGIRTNNGSISLLDGPILVVDPLVYGTGSLSLEPAAGDLTFLVGNSADSGDRSLRTVIGYALANAAPTASSQASRIEFDGAINTITVSAGALPLLTKPLAFDGEANRLERVQLRGVGTAALTSGLRFADGSEGSQVRSMVVTGFTGAAAVELRSVGTSVSDCWLGLDPAGNAAANLNGVVVTGSAAVSNFIGGPDSADRNVIAGNTGDGIAIRLGASDNVVAGNFIGVDMSGVARANRGAGISVIGSPRNTVSDGNVIAGNVGDGIVVDGSAGTTIIGTMVGVNAAGDAAIRNGGSGIVVRGATSTGTIIGLESSRNIISGNGARGVVISGGAAGITLQGNWIGLATDGVTPLGNASAGVRIDNASGNTVGAGNIISGNEGNGIEIVGGASKNTVTQVMVGTDSDGGLAVANGGSGIRITGGMDNTVGSGSTLSGNTRYGVEINGAAVGTRVIGAYVGLNKLGTAGIPNALGGVLVEGLGTSKTYVGGTDPNVISGNGGAGITITGRASDTTLDSNFIGLNSSGNMAVANDSHGIFVDGGGKVIGRANVVSGNTGDGIRISGAVAAGSEITGSSIGVDSLGVKVIGNDGAGITLLGTSHIRLGGLSQSDANIVSGNKGHGIVVGGAENGEGSSLIAITGNIVGLDASGLIGLGNTLDGISLQGQLTVNVAIESNTVSANAMNGLAVSANAGQVTISGNRFGTTLDGTRATGNGLAGISIVGGKGNTIGGVSAFNGNVVSGNSNDGISLTGGTTNNIVSSNLIGLNTKGTSGLGNGGNGISISDSPANVVASNTVSGNSAAGIVVSLAGSFDVEVRGNSVGTDLTATRAIGNGLAGIEIDRAAGVLVGGPSAGDRNVISGNTGDGVVVRDTTAAEIRGNYVGLSGSGLGRLGNQGNGIVVERSSGVNIYDGNRIAFSGVAGAGTGHGILIDDESSDNFIGSLTSLSSGNVVYGNVLDGVHISGGSTNTTVLGNYIGTNSSLVLNLGNGGSGVAIEASNGNTIGANLLATSRAPSLGNIILGNRDGVTLIDAEALSKDEGNSVIGNLIQSSRRYGVHVVASFNQAIGGQRNEVANTIVLSGDAGVVIDQASTEITVQGNFIGTNAASVARLGNKGAGIRINDSVGNIIGGSTELLGNHLQSNAIGISIVGTPDGAELGNVLLSNTIRGNTAQGIRLQDSNFNRVGNTPESGNTITANGSDGILVLGGSEGNVIQANRIGVDGVGVIAANLGDGVEINAGSNNTLRANLIRGNSGVGVRLAGGSSNTVGGESDADVNSVIGNKLDGIAITSGSLTNTVTRNVIDANGGNGIALASSSSNTVSTNTVVRNVAAGIAVTAGSQLNSIMSNKIGTDGTTNAKLGNVSYGVLVDRSLANTVVGNTVSQNVAGGLLVSNSAAGSLGLANVVSRNVVQANRGVGISLHATSGSRIVDNTVGGETAFGLGNVVGIALTARSTGNEIATNRVEGSGRAGISVTGSSANSLDGNEVVSNKGNGVELDAGSTGNLLSKNFIGSLRDGLGVRGNAGNGVSVTGGLGNTLDTNTILDNVFSGIAIAGSLAANIGAGNSIVGNLAGRNGTGVSISGSRWQTLGTPAKPNIITGNLGTGVMVAANSANIVIESNSVTGNGRDGVLLSSSTATTIRGNSVSSNQFNGINIDAAKSLSPAAANRLLSNTVTGNKGSGVLVSSKTQYAEIGTAAEGNTIVRNGGNGIAFASGATINRVAGNFIGTDKTGTLGLGNNIDGVRITSSSGNIVGSGNTIANNTGAGVRLIGGTNNTIGDRTGTQGNTIRSNSGGGVRLEATSTGNFISANVITDNLGDGVAIVGKGATDNVIGVQAAAVTTTGVGNTISRDAAAAVRIDSGIRNQIFGNMMSANGLGIVLTNGGNAAQMSPVLATATVVMLAGRPQLQITGSVRGQGRQKMILEFFANPGPASPVQAQTPLGRVAVTTAANGTATFTILLDVDASAMVGNLLTATATTASGVIGNTSVISRAIAITSAASARRR